MIKRSEVETGREAAVDLLKKAHIMLSDAERMSLEVADFGLTNWPAEGSQIATIVNTDRIGLKLICLLPGQTLPEHWHTAIGDTPGKEETLRVAYGTLRLYLPGVEMILEGRIPEGKEPVYTCRNEVILRAPEQITLIPGTKHWMQGGAEGTVVYSISSAATCPLDPFTDPTIKRMPEIMEGT